jgi:hypothetical protein
MTLHLPRLKQQAQIRRLPDQITINYGPREQLGRFFLAADKAARDRGVSLSLSTDFELLREVNARNYGSWHGLAPSFDCAYGGIDSSCGFWIVGRDSSGEIVTTQAARFFDTGSENLRDYLVSLRLFYPDPEKQKLPQESCAVTSAAALQLSGRIVYSGGTWIHPDYRKRLMPMILPRISRALALTRWDTSYTFSMVSHALVSKGVAAAYGYRNIEPGIRWMNSPSELRLDGTLVWMDRAHMLQDMAGFDDMLERAEDKRGDSRLPENRIPALN